MTGKGLYESYAKTLDETINFVERKLEEANKEMKDIEDCVEDYQNTQLWKVFHGQRIAFNRVKSFIDERWEHHRGLG